METEEAAIARMKRMEHPDREEKRFNQMMDEQEKKLQCPGCGGELETLKCEIPSGDTHQCVKCFTLYAPYGKE